jgi:hypothetical protein
MLEEMTMVGDENIVSWQPHGRAFRVHQPDVFARTVMSRYFKQTKYKSFLRQLHIYGFQRIQGNGKDRGAYFHSMFIRNKKAMSLRMSCKKIKGMQNKTSNAVRQHHRRARVVDPDFYSMEIKVDKDQNQDRRDLTNVLLQGDQILQESATIKKEKRGRSSKLGPAAAYTAGSSDSQPDEEKPALVDCDLLYNQEASGSSPSQSHHLIDSEIGLLLDWMEQDRPQTIISRHEQGLASPYHGYANPAPEKGHEASGLLHGWDHDQKHGNEGFFAGKRFFYVVETNMMPMVEDFNEVVNGGGRMFYIPRSA